MSVTLAEPTTAPGPAGLEEWAQSFLTLARVSGDMAQTAFVPQSLRVFHNDGRDYDPAATAAQVTAAILTGRELGLEPMAALRSIHVINASPALSALALRAIVLGAGHRIWVEEATKTRAIVAGVRAGDTHEQRVTWTMDDAKSRGLAGKRNWRVQPRNMLIARATAEVARLVAADAILGVPYVIEELEDEDTGEIVPEPPPAADSKPLRRRRKPATPALVSRSQATTEPPPREDEPPLDDLPPATPKASDEQLKKLFAMFKERGLEDRDDRLDWSNKHLDRTIVSAAELTDIEASSLIDALEEEGRDQAPAQPQTAPPTAEGPAAPDSEQQTLGEPTITKEAAEVLVWMGREANIDDQWMRDRLEQIGAEPPAQGPVRLATLRQLTKSQASELTTALNEAIDRHRQETEADDDPESE